MKRTREGEDVGGKAPSFQFYPRDWLTESGLRSVSLAARGLWIELLCHAHQSPRRGFLLHGNGQPMTTKDIARLVGTRTDLCVGYLGELSATGVYSIEEGTGAIYSRRMVKDERVSAIRRAAGRRGGNPNLVKQTENFAYPKVEQNPTPSSPSPFPSPDTPKAPEQKPKRTSTFDEFRNLYPEPKRNTKVEPACRAYVGRVSGTAGEHERLMAGLERHLASESWHRSLAEDSGRFIPSMEKFISDGLYLDHPPAAALKSDPGDLPEYRPDWMETPA